MLVKEIQLHANELDWSGVEMANTWQANIILELRMIGITQKQFARECGYSEPYMSQVLRCRKDTPQAKEKIVETLERIKRECGESA